METNFCNTPPVKTYVPTTTNCDEPIIPLSHQPVNQPVPHPFQLLPMPNKLFQALKLGRKTHSPQTYPQLNQAQTFSNAHYACRQPPQPNFPLPNQHPTPFIYPANVSLPTFWESTVKLWFSTAEHTFRANGIFNEHRCFSLVLGALDIKMIQKIQHVVRSPTSYPYQDVKKALIKACKVNENDCLDIFFNRTELGDRKPCEMPSEMRQLLEAYDTDNTQTMRFSKSFVLISFQSKLEPFWWQI